MSIIDDIKSLFKRGSNMLTTGKTLSNIVDDSRINIDPREYDRIKRDFEYYSNKFKSVSYLDATGAPKTRPLNYINLTKRASQRIASIVFNEQCEINFDNKQVNDYLNRVFKDNDFFNQFELALEKGIVAGGFAMRPYVDGDNIKIAWVRADQFYPLRSNTNSIAEATIASRTTISGANGQIVYYTLLEFHQWQNGNYVITNELYSSNDSNIVGKQVPLNTIYANMSDRVEIDGKDMKAPLFSYFRMPGANNISIESPLGVGIADNNKPTLDALNVTHDNFFWEIRNGRKRIAVDQSMLRFDGKTHKPQFDVDTDVYVPLGSQSEDLKITDLTSDIRVADFENSMNVYLREFESNVGMAQGTFSYDSDKGLQTATQVVSENSMTYQTRASILTNVTACIQQLCVAILELSSYDEFFENGSPFDYTTIKNADNSQFDLGNLGMNIKYNDGVFVDKDKQLEEDMKAVVAGVMSKQTFLKRNYNMNDDMVKQELANIKAEQPEPADAGTQTFGE